MEKTRERILKNEQRVSFVVSYNNVLLISEKIFQVASLLIKYKVKAAVRKCVLFRKFAF